MVLVTIISVGVVAFLLAIFLYHLIFVVLDLRKIMDRVNDITAEVEKMIIKPVEAASVAMRWLQKLVWDLYVSEVEGGETKKREKKKEKRKRKKKKK